MVFQVEVDQTVLVDINVIGRLSNDCKINNWKAISDFNQKEAERTEPLRQEGKKIEGIRTGLNGEARMKLGGAASWLDAR